MTQPIWGLPAPRSITGSGITARVGDGRRLVIEWPTHGAREESIKAAAIGLVTAATGVEAIDSLRFDGACTDVVVSVESSWRPADGTIAPARGIDPHVTPVDERYLLVIEADAPARIVAASPQGALHGLMRFGQLIGSTEADGSGWLLPVTTVIDGPTWRWRGLSVDTVRHFYSVTEIKRIIDLSAWHGLSVLHLHLSDTQDWRLEIRRRPELTAGNADTYSQADFQCLVEYAAARGVVIVPEIDLPGHVAAAAARIPELTAGKEFAHPMLVFLDPDEDAVREFTRDVIAELAELSPGGFVHIGGDEAFGMPIELYGQFIDLAVDLVRAAGKKPLAWQEGIRGSAFRPGDALQLWMSPEDAFDPVTTKERVPEQFWPMVDLVAETFSHAPTDAPAAARAGIQLIASPSGSVYLDRRYGEPSLDPAQTERLKTVGFEAYAAKPTSTVFTWDPLTAPEIIEAGGITGGAEAAIWSETITSFDDLAMLLLPRLGILAERMWSSGDEPRDDIAQRTAAQAGFWTRLGFDAFYRSSEIFSE